MFLHDDVEYLVTVELLTFRDSCNRHHNFLTAAMFGHIADDAQLKDLKDSCFVIVG